MYNKYGQIELMACPGCNTWPGQVHVSGCEIEICSQCGEPRQGGRCGCKNHDPAFARWTGFIPGAPEAQVLGIDMDAVFDTELNKIILVKPKIKNEIINNWKRKF